jgi:AbrB family looped-hinge helix DNA binding protein
MVGSSPKFRTSVGDRPNDPDAVGFPLTDKGGRIRAYKVRVNEQGRVVIPADLRSSLGFKPGSFVTLEVLGHGEIKLSTLGAAIKHARAIAKKYVRVGAPSVVEELIADRRREAERE